MRLKNCVKYLLLIICFASSAYFAQERVKLVSYNILNYPNQSSTKNPKFQLILNEIDPDILVVQEILSQAAVNLFLAEVLGDEYDAGDFINGPDTDNAIFFKDSLFTFISTDFLPTTPRYISVFKLYHKITLDTLIIYSAHFKAGNNPSDENTRLNEASVFRIFTDMLPVGTDFILVGDLNLYRSTEPAYMRLLEQNESGYVLDPINRSGNWHDNLGFADIHTQSTRVPDLGDGGSTNGLDDRFDFILVSQSIMDSSGIDYAQDSYWAFGNDGLHFNLSIHDPPNQSVSTETAIALYIASDHLPVVAEFDFGVISAVEDENLNPQEYILYQNYPNPFNPATVISWQMAVGGKVTIIVYDVLGNEVTTIVNEEKLAGIHEVIFDASNLPSGVYFYRLTTENFSSSKNMILLK